MSDSQHVQIHKVPIKINELYSLHRASVNGHPLFVKVFYNQAINKYGLQEVIDYNSEVLEDQYETLQCNDNLLPILKTYPHDNDGILFVIPQYKYQLNEYIEQKGGLSEQQVMTIAEDIIKAIFCLYISGFFHRSMRLENFVWHEDLWKLSSLVLDEATNSEGFTCEYIWSKQHMPSQFYKNQSYLEQQLDEKIVWDFGSMLINMLLGSNKLKNFEIMEKFKGSPFSFEALGIGIGSRISPQLKEMLGKMCHYNPEERMKLKNLIRSGFFSKQVANLSKNIGVADRKIFMPGLSSASQSINPVICNKLKIKPMDTKEIREGYEDQEKKRSVIFAEDPKTIERQSELTKKIERLQKIEKSFIKRQRVTESRVIDIDDILILNNKKINIINQFKNQLNKGQLLTISEAKLRKAIELEDDQLKSEALLLLTKYALYFVKAMNFHLLASAINNNVKVDFIQFDEQWDRFHGSSGYNSLCQLINYRKQQSIAILNNLRSSILEKPLFNLQYFTESVNDFVTTNKPQNNTFFSIKVPYREILKKSYNMVAHHYSRNKTQEWATIGMYLTYCLTIDKLYIPSDFKDNFRHYFQWVGQQQEYIPLQNFQNYMEKADQQTLVENSTYIIRKYYKLD